MSSGAGRAVQQQLTVRIEQILMTRVLPDLIESDVRRGDRRMLDAALGQLAQHVEVIKTPVAAALLARSEAMAATGPEAEAGFVRAIAALEPKDEFRACQD